MKPNEKIKEFINSKKSLPVLIGTLCIGLLIVLFSNNSLTSRTDANEEASTKNAPSFSSNHALTIDESRLEVILSQISGVGDADVLITYKSTAEDVALKDEDSEGNETTVMHNESSSAKPYISKKLYPQIEGVIIVAEGGDNAEMRSIIADAVSAVFEIPIHKVKVLKMK